MGIKILLLFFFLIFIPTAYAAQQQKQQEPRTHEEWEELDKRETQMRVIQIFIQQQQIIANQEKIDNRLESLRPYQEQVKINTDRITRLESLTESMDARIWGVTIAVLAVVLGMVGHFLLTKKQS